MITRNSRHTAGFPFHCFRIHVLPSFLLLFLVLVLPNSSGARAADKHEDSYALIFGTVWGPDNRPVYGVKVAIRRADDKKARWHLVSEHNGEFAQRVPGGKADYLVWAETVPWKRSKSSRSKDLGDTHAVKVHIENDERVDMGLHLTE